MLKKIYAELVLIRKELQAINGSKEFKIFVPEDSTGICENPEVKLSCH